ncbi:hypothetical protein TPS_09237 [Trichinella pseudospiralis]
MGKSTSGKLSTAAVRVKLREGRAYNLKRTNMEDKHWVCRQVKKGCWSSMHTNLKVDTSSLIFCSSCR